MRGRPAKTVDLMTLSLYLCLIAIGWSVLFSVGYNGGYDEGISDFLLHTQAGKQTIWVLISLVVYFFTQIIERKFWQTFAFPIYVFSLLLLVLVLVFGKEIKGATSWFAFGGFSIQPSEFAKFGACLATAAYLSRMNVNLRHLKNQAIAMGLILLPTGLILLQPDAGSALIFFSFLLLFYRKGFPNSYYVLGFSLAALLILGIIYEETPLRVVWGIALLAVLPLVFIIKNQLYAILGFLALVIASWFSMGDDFQYINYVFIGLGLIFLALGLLNMQKGNGKTVGLALGLFIVASGLVLVSSYSFKNFLARHQKDRINVWLNPSKCDPQGSLYNLIQSKKAIANGGFEGQGFLKGNMTQLNFVPEQSTDFIFSAIGEEHGFIGTFAIISFFLLLLWRITQIAERQRSEFVKWYAYGVAGIIFIHVLVNVGMTMGLMPVIGIPLPFISKGGSALMGFSLMIGVLLKMDRHRTET